jgi:lysophospholipase L1-like esterase
VLVLGPLPRWLEHQPDVVLRLWQRTQTIVDRTTIELDPALGATDDALRAALPADIRYVSPLGRLCDAHGCKVLTNYRGKLEPLVWDDAHLTIAGSEVLARALMPDIER